MPTLHDADELRSTDRALALAMYAKLARQIPVDDEERLLWICEQVAPTPPFELASVLERVPDTASSPLRRAALHCRSTIAWFQGNSEESEQLLLDGLRFPDTPRDRTWIRTCLNLSMTLHARCCMFEPLVLAGMGKRGARDVDIPYLTAFATVRRAELLIEMGDFGRATDEIAETTELVPRVTDSSERRVIEYSRRGAIAALCVETGDPARGLAEREEQLQWLVDYEHVEDAILAEVRIAILALRFDLTPDDRERILAEFEKLPDEFDLGPSWTRTWWRDLLELRLRHSIEQNDRESALAQGLDLIGTLADERSHSRRATRALRLARLLAHDLHEPKLGRQAYEIASTATLRRVLEADRSAREIPELAEASPDDWTILSDYREHLAAERTDLLDAVAADLQPGEAAFDLLVKDEIVNICAWCYRARTNNGAWLPVAHFIPQSPNFRVSHGICADCGERFFADEV